MESFGQLMLIDSFFDVWLRNSQAGFLPVGRTGDWQMTDYVSRMPRLGHISLFCQNLTNISSILWIGWRSVFFVSFKDRNKSMIMTFSPISGLKWVKIAHNISTTERSQFVTIGMDRTVIQHEFVVTFILYHLSGVAIPRTVTRKFACIDTLHSSGWVRFPSPPAFQLKKGWEFLLQLRPLEDVPWFMRWHDYIWRFTLSVELSKVIQRLADALVILFAIEWGLLGSRISFEGLFSPQLGPDCLSPSLT